MSGAGKAEAAYVLSNNGLRRLVAADREVFKALLRTHATATAFSSAFQLLMDVPSVCKRAAQQAHGWSDRATSESGFDGFVMGSKAIWDTAQQWQPDELFRVVSEELAQHQSAKEVLQ